MQRATVCENGDASRVNWNSILSAPMHQAVAVRLARQINALSEEDALRAYSFVNEGDHESAFEEAIEHWGEAKC